jgi:phosphatidylglycerophosphate synthase
VAVSVVNPANAVTASRFLTLPPFFYAVDHGMAQWGLLMVLICGLLDKLDGLVAKLFHCKSDFGAFFDAIADAVCYGFFVTVLAAYGWVPWPPVVAFLGLGGINSALRAVYARRAQRPVNYRSFAMERIVAFAAYLGGFGIAGYQVDFYYYTCVSVMAVVVIHDAKRMLFDPIPEPAEGLAEAS